MRGVRLAVLAVGMIALTGGPATGQQITWSISFNDPAATYSAYYDRLDTHLRAAGARWNQFLVPATNVTVAVRVEFDTNIPRSTGNSVSSSFVGTQSGLNVFEQGVATLVRTGTDVNGTTPDMVFRINPGYMQNTLWFDPNPFARTATPDATRTDAMSVTLHEVGHALGFNGWRNGTTGALPGDYMSTFDRHVVFDGQNQFFHGPNARAVYNGNPIPLTYDNAFHLGNEAPRPGQDLLPDLMNGVVFFNGQRYDVSLLDRAILMDCGVPMTPVPEPAVGIAVGAVIASGLVWRRVRRSREIDAGHPAVV